MTTAGQFALACATVAGAALAVWAGMEACGRILDRLFDRQGRAGACTACTCECALFEAAKRKAGRP